MIVSHEGKFFIATPTKCGTTTLEHIAKRPQNVGKLEVAGPIEGQDSRRRQHRMVPDPAWGDYRPYLLTRNPYSRWVSVYEYLRAPQNYSQWGARAVQGREWGGLNPDVLSELADQRPMGFKRFLRWIAESRAEYDNPIRRGALKSSKAYRSPWVWLDSQVDSRYALGLNAQYSPGRLRLEHLGEELPTILRSHGVHGADLRMVQANRTKKPKHKRWQDYYAKPGVLAVAHGPMAIDVEARSMGYEVLS